MVAARWERWLHHVRRSDLGHVVAVTHAGVIRVALARGGQGSSALEAHIPFGSVHRLDLGMTPHHETTLDHRMRNQHE
jgi:broad specificity phosphatase PhoE